MAYPTSLDTFPDAAALALETLATFAPTIQPAEVVPADVNVIVDFQPLIAALAANTESNHAVARALVAPVTREVTAHDRDGRIQTIKETRG